MKDTAIAPSVLAADFANLQRDIEMLNESEADWIHVDIMDGIFVPNISFGIPVCQAIQKHAKKPLDVHLMIKSPDDFLEAFKDAGADRLTVHYETLSHLHRTIGKIKELGCKAGVALNPHTPVSGLEDIIHELDLVLIMSVNPGFGGQQFIEHTYSKILKLKKLAEETQADIWIEIDGGVTDQNASALVKAGANALVAGSFVFKSPEPLSTISGLKKMTASKQRN
ncbi:ribulose-phosphate 3-epimerase [Catalinimonas alkaloidigena]|uniref:ribulose-phosphate 3-epimerase n=1 Tax=Catalinimonas alkaloidigena TaxID=1075417 RepID=UPI002405FA39|nr:ribulose-phosphate 3-epimerase [Catalinimonas alkaloidigena]MDF9795949.1 ribulose-phosphate 3-epimerase [Catalinimonas alkaloidigena]